ncbi:hypothetical protein CTAYLR_010404 [Chrysophaeum taylorii]|uniref:Chlorophyll a-b binding protein, chloroplastic n=1 Tax=Chrysophaeum taylorii TaxID=2483200 RepID=A0AAD7UIF5_9STRA|nr:hypothetical protein CTAYLR_010404 [Chrysophaeum taylorii]
MKCVLALAFGSASAFVAQTATTQQSSALLGAKEDLVALAEANTDAIGKSIGFWDPLGASSLDFFGLELSGRLPAGATIGYLRHAEIKHGRVAMAAFVGYCVQANGIHFPWTPFPGFTEGLSPPEQWAALPPVAKWQFFVYIGILEALGECFPAGEHYAVGGKPGVYPSIKTPNDQMASCLVYPWHGFPLDLFDPFGTVAKLPEEKKERGRRVEINNGRLAMLGIFGFLSEQKVPGSVPFLTGLVKPLPDMEIMGPFVGTDGVASIF